jgi:RND family efflux transporter MFP subunit
MTIQPNSRWQPSRPLLLITLLAMLTAKGCTKPADAETAAQPLPVDMRPVELQQSYEVTRHFVGEVRSKSTSHVGFEMDGRVESLTVDEGDTIERGEVLARLDTRRLRAQRNELTARLEEVDARLGLASATTERVEQLNEKDFATGQRLDEARFGEQAARASRRRLEAAIDRLDVEIRKSVLRAPYTGEIQTRHVDPGMVVSAGTPVVTLDGRERPEVVVSVPPALAREFENGQAHDVVVADQTHTADVVGRINRVDPASRSVPIILEFTDAADVVDGQVARLAYTRTEHADGAWVPLGGLTESTDGLWSVMRVEKTDSENTYRVVREDVVVLHTETDRAFVRGTLSDDSRIIASGIHRVTPGQLVLASENAP